MRHLSVGYAEPLRSELVAFVDAVRGGELPAVTGDEAVASLEIAIRCVDARAPQAALAQRKGPRRAAG
jgi:predicted dehydrogenase